MNNICPTTGKRQYASDKEARRGMEKFRERMPGYDGTPYLCLYCGCHHFGSRKEPAKRRRKRA